MRAPVLASSSAAPSVRWLAVLILATSPYAIRYATESRMYALVMFLVLAAYAEVAGFHDRLQALTAAAGAPLFVLGAPAADGGYGGLWIDRLLELVVLLDLIAMAIGCCAAASRGLFAMARDRRVPAALAVVSRRHGTPLLPTARADL